MIRIASIAAGAALLTLALVQLTAPLLAAPAEDPQVARGRYLVNTSLCQDCHTPGFFFGKPDQARYLGGSDVGFEMPGLGVFYGRNLTPDPETGLGTWTVAQIVSALQTGVRPDGRKLAPIMPFEAFAKLTKQDATSIALFLKSLPPVKNKVAGPFGPNQQPTAHVFKIIPPPAAQASR